MLPKVASIDILLASAFIKWGWRWNKFQGWLVPFPNINGTWQGYIQTTWKDPKTGERPGPIPTILTIKQTFTIVSCLMKTGEMISHSYAEGFRIESDQQIKQLAYSYTSRPIPSVIERSAPHEGTILFNIIGTPVSKLEGQYWTSRKTTGEISLVFREASLLDEIPEDLGKHPMS